MRMILGREIRDDDHFVDYKIVLTRYSSIVSLAQRPAYVIGPAPHPRKLFYTGIMPPNNTIPRNWLFLPGAM